MTRQKSICLPFRNDHQNWSRDLSFIISLHITKPPKIPSWQNPHKPQQSQPTVHPQQTHPWNLNELPSNLCGFWIPPLVHSLSSFSPCSQKLQIHNKDPTCKHEMTLVPWLRLLMVYLGISKEGSFLKSFFHLKTFPNSSGLLKTQDAKKTLSWCQQSIFPTLGSQIQLLQQLYSKRKSL